MLPVGVDLVAWGTAGLVVVGVVTLVLTYLEVRRGVKIRTAERASTLMSRLIDIEKVAVEHPHLAAYFQRGVAPPAKLGELRDQVFAYALLYTDFGETVAWQIRAGQMSKDSASDWRAYFADLCRRMPAIAEVLTRDGWMLAAETLWLFGAGPATKAVRKLGIEENLELLQLRGARKDELLADVHRILFIPNFPDPDEQETVDDWARRLWDDVPLPHPEQYGVVAGLSLEDPNQRILAGFAFVERYRESRTALLSYIAVDPNWRGLGLSTQLFNAARDSAREAAERAGAPLKAVFAEIHDPARVLPGADSIDPTTRARIMAALGGMRIPISYVQPPLSPESARSDRLILIAFPPGHGMTIASETVRAFLDEYFRALDVSCPESDPDFALMMSELERLGPDIPLERLTSSPARL